MSPFTESRCPLCRTKYGHLPNVISKLHSFLNAVFPEEYGQREAENAEEEKQDEVASPDVSNAVPAKSTPITIAIEDFSCDICQKLLFKPTVLTCGHVVCGTPCLDKGKLPLSNTSGGGSSSERHYVCACGVCGQPLVTRPRLCKQLEDLIQSVFKEEYSAREAVERERDSIISPRNKIKKDEKITKEDHPATAAAIQAQDNETAPATAQPQLTGTQRQPQSEQNPPPPASSISGLTGPHAEIYKMLQGSKDYTHFGIGCDSCGQFPITGRRYRCTDCPETVGFDLCGECYDRGVSRDPNAVVGRFNQRHTPEHSMELCRPRLTSLHMLRAANPELSFDQLMYLLQMSSEREDDTQVGGGRSGGEAGNGSSGGGGDVSRGEEGERHQEQPEERAELEEDIPIILHGRGPRPVQDPSAQWPSPSSFGGGQGDDMAAQMEEPVGALSLPPLGEEEEG